MINRFSNGLGGEIHPLGMLQHLFKNTVTDQFPLTEYEVNLSLNKEGIFNYRIEEKKTVEEYALHVNVLGYLMLEKLVESPEIGGNIEDEETKGWRQITFYLKKPNNDYYKHTQIVLQREVKNEGFITTGGTDMSGNNWISILTLKNNANLGPLIAKGLLYGTQVIKAEKDSDDNGNLLFWETVKKPFIKKKQIKFI